MKTILKGKTSVVTIDTEGPVMIIGESINPTRRKKLVETLSNHDFDFAIQLGKSQMDAGADVLDVNVGYPGVDDASLLPATVKAIQDALDILKFTSKRAASMIAKVLKSAVAGADEQQADTEKLYVSCARVDDAGIRIGTKRFIEKDRGRAHPIQKKACHIHVTVTQA